MRQPCAQIQHRSVTPTGFPCCIQHGYIAFIDKASKLCQRQKNNCLNPLTAWICESAFLVAGATPTLDPRRMSPHIPSRDTKHGAVKGSGPVTVTVASGSGTCDGFETLD